MAILRFTVEAETQHISGRFAPRGELVDQILEALESADPGEISGVGSEGNTTYEIVNWMVEEA